MIDDDMYEIKRIFSFLWNGKFLYFSKMKDYDVATYSKKFKIFVLRRCQ